MRLLQTLAGDGWRRLDEEELQQDNEVPPGSELIEKSVQIQMETSGKNLQKGNGPSD